MKKENVETYKLLENHDELIIDKNFRYHLYRNCEELTVGKEALFATSYINNYWKFRDRQGFEHLYNDNNEELTIGIKTMVIECYKNGYWKYMAKNGSWNIIDNTGHNITPDVPYIYECIVYEDGKIDYRENKDSEFSSI